jgi:copper homeostasis protein (lipoprotein)
MIKRFFSNMRRTSMSLLVILVTISCGSPPDEAEPEFMPPDMHNSMISLDWSGTYHGVTPCTDCEGVDSKITLNDDLTYQTERIYLGKSEQIFRNEGTFTWSEDGSRIRLNDLNPSNTPALYQVGENRLFQLGMDGNRIEGRLADQYILTKVIDNLSGLQWELIELDGRNIKVVSQSLQTPTLHFSTDSQSISGTGSCNRFNGKYEIKSKNKISFTNVSSTRMGCENMDIERKYFETLERASRYSLNHDTLSLNYANQAYIARFLLQDE